MTELILNLSTSTWLSLIVIIVLSSFLMMIFIANGFSIKLKELREKNDKLIFAEVEDGKKLKRVTKENDALKAEQKKDKIHIEELERIKVAYESKQEEFFKTEHKLREVQEQLESVSNELGILKGEYLQLQKDYKRILKRNEELISKR
ncbi:MAG: hypothetical protein JXQ68_00455 [Campylobacterales bacterium]|nr:hypothetical protein [Campylobacterales bacterium]